MNRAMYSGVAGLKTHQTRMDVIGNNIANVNTVGYKSQTALFAELLYQNSSNATGPNAETNIGGVNPKQVGLGAKMASINTNITLPGSAETTNNPFDIRLTGSSFFIVNNGKENMFTRDGSFKVDAAGNLVMSSNGFKVMGWQPDTENPGQIKQDTVSALQIMSAANMTYPAEATTQAHVSGIVDAQSPEVGSPDGKIMNLNFYDSRGYSYTAKMAIKRVADKNTTVNSYSCELVKVLDAKGNEVTMKDPAGNDVGVAALGKDTQVTLLNSETKTIPNGYKITDKGADSYTIQYGDPAGEHYEYVIKDGTIEGTYYKNATDSISFTDLRDDTKYAATDPLKSKVRDEWEEVAKAFGYSSSYAFKTMAVKADSVGKKLFSIMNTAGVEADPAAGDIDPTKRTITFTDRVIDGLVINFSKDNGTFKGLGENTDGTTKSATLTFDRGGDAASFKDIQIDFSTLENVSNNKTSTAGATSGSLDNDGAGRMVGRMSGITIGTEGKIYATYDNGQSKLLGQIAVARFANASGLQKEGDNLYVATQNSGDFDGIGSDVTSDGNKMTPGELEMSNVDLSGELTGMIVTQRGFQANSRIITVSDTMLEELINLKR